MDTNLSTFVLTPAAGKEDGSTRSVRRAYILDGRPRLTDHTSLAVLTPEVLDSRRLGALKMDAPMLHCSKFPVDNMEWLPDYVEEE